MIDVSYPYTASSLQLLNKKPIIIDDSEIILFCCARNEQWRFPYFMNYYKTLGIDRFIFIDNDSNDGTADYLLSHQSTHVFYTKKALAPAVVESIG